MASSGTFYPGASGDDGYATFNPACGGFDNSNVFSLLGSQRRPFIRFRNVNIPKGSTITNAYIRFHAFLSEAPSVDVTLNFKDADDPAAPTNCSELDADSSAVTDEPVAWEIPTWTQNNEYNTPDISAPLQEVINREGWSSGNSVLFISHWVTRNANKYFDSWDNAGSDYAELHVEWTEPEAAQIENDFTLRWPLTYRVPKTIEMLYNIGMQSVNNDFVMLNSLTAQLVKDFTLNYALIVSSDLVIPYSLVGPAEKDFVLRYDITNQIHSDWELKWSIEMSADWVMPYALQHEVLRDWEIITPIQMNVDFVMPYSLTAAVERDWTLRNDIEAKIYEAFEMKYGIEVSKDIQMVNSVQQTLDAVFVMKNHITGVTEADTELKFNILDKDPVSVEFELRNALLGKPVIYKITFTD
jgi:hypothetical protein